MAINQDNVADALIPTTGALTITGVVSVSNGLFVNSRTISTSYAIPTGYSAHSVGPITLNTGVTVTVPSGSRWLIL